jgi:hypothetical protein
MVVGTNLDGYRPIRVLPVSVLKSYRGGNPGLQNLFFSRGKAQTNRGWESVQPLPR